MPSSIAPAPGNCPSLRCRQTLQINAFGRSTRNLSLIGPGTNAGHPSEQVNRTGHVPADVPRRRLTRPTPRPRMNASSARKEVIRERPQDSGWRRAVLRRVRCLGRLGLPDGLLLIDRQTEEPRLGGAFLFQASAVRVGDGIPPFASEGPTRELRSRCGLEALPFGDAHQPHHLSTVAASKPAAAISSRDCSSSTYRCRIASSTSYGGSES